MIAREWLCGGPDAPPMEARLKLTEQLRQASGLRVIPTKWGERPPKSQVRIYPHRLYGIPIPDAAIWVLSPQEVADARTPKPPRRVSATKRGNVLIDSVLERIPAEGERIRKSLQRGHMSRRSLEMIIRAAQAQALEEKA